MPTDRCDLLCLDLPSAEALRHSRLTPEAATHPAARARAFSDPTRLAVAAALHQGGELCVCDLAWVCERAQNLVSHHVRALRAAGIASSRREGRTVLYALTDEGRALFAALVPEPAESVP